LDCTLAASLAVLGNLLYQQCGDRDAASCALAKAEEAIASYSGLVDDATSYYCDVADTQVFDRDTQPLNAPVGDPDGALGCTLNAVLVDGGGAQALLDACTASSDGGPDRINLNDVTPGAACNFVYTKAMEELALFVLDSPLVNCLLALPSNMGHWQFNGVPCTGTLNE
jgi:hypothetical protein